MGKFGQIVYAAFYIGMLSLVMYLFGIRGFICMVTLGTFLFPMSQVKWFLIGILLGSMFGGFDFENPLKGFVFSASNDSPWLWGLFGAIIIALSIIVGVAARRDFAKSGFKGTGDEQLILSVIGLCMGVVAILLSLTGYFF